MKIEPQRPRIEGNSAILLLTIIFLIANCGSVVYAQIAGTQDDTRVSATWQVLKYDITATLPANDSDRNLSAKAKLDIKNVSARPAGTLTLRISPSADVSTLSVNGAANEFTKAEEKTGTGSLQRLVVKMPTVAPGGTVSVAVDYKLNVKDNTGLAAISSAGSQFLPLSFWYPTPNSWFFARGADYAPTRIQVTSAGQTIVSSGSESGGAFEGKFGTQPFFLAGNWEVTNSGGVSVFLPKGENPDEQKRASELASLAAEAKSYVESRLGKGQDVPIRLISVRRGAGFSSGGTILFDEAVLRRPKLDSQTTMIVAEGVAKTWLGGSVSVNGDGGGAIREGLSRYLATQFIESKFGKEVADVERLRQRVAYAAVVLRDQPINSVSPLDDYYYAVVANKAAMLWRLLEIKSGAELFGARIKASIQDGNVTLAEIRTAFPEQKEFLDYGFDQTTDMNLRAGLPQQGTGESKVALQNTGSVDVTVDVEATLENGQRLTASTTLRSKNFGEVTFKTGSKIRRVEIDREKLYPQTDFSDDIAPRELTDSDLLLAVKRSFDKQEYANAEKTARAVLLDFPRFDDVRIFLARSLLALGRNSDAEKEFKAVLDEKLPSSRSIGWALVGLADIASRANQNEQAVKFATEALRADAEYGASLSARNIRNKAGSKNSDPSVAAYFEQFDKAAAANQKAALDSLVVPGEASRFASGVAGQTVQWKTEITHVDLIDNTTAIVETNLSIKLLNREPESGLAVYRLTRVGSGWKLSSVDVFEVR